MNDSINQVSLDRIKTPSVSCSTNTKSYSSRRNHLVSFFASGIGFLADAYDFFVIDSVFDIIKNTAAMSPNNASQNMVITATLVGAVLGQIGFGLGADFIGRRQMFLITSALVTLGSVGSALVGFHYQDSTTAITIYHQLMVFRFILGVGIGGEYPLSASVSMESSDEEDEEEGYLTKQNNKSAVLEPRKHWLWFLHQKPNSLAAVFSLQGVGLLLSSLVIMAFLALHFSLETTWRLCLGLGAVPSAVAFYFRWKMHESIEFKSAAKRFGEDRDSCSTEPSSDTNDSHFKDKSLSQEEEKKYAAVNNVYSLKKDNPNDGVHSASPYTTVRSIRTESEEPGNCKLSFLNFSRCKKHYRKSSKLLYSFRYALIGSSLSWFLIDITLYGVASYKTDLSKMLLQQMELPKFSPSLSSALSNPNTNSVLLQDPVLLRTLEYQESIRSSVLKRTKIGFLFTLLGLPGYIVSVFFIHKINLKKLQLWGFFGVSLVFAIMSIVHFVSLNNLPSDIFLLGLTFFFSNFGPNTTTYILPTQLFPTIIRATCHGFSAAMGKVGAVVGTVLVKVVETHFGLSWLFLTCSFVSILGALVTHTLVESEHEKNTALESQHFDCNRTSMV